MKSQWGLRVSQEQKYEHVKDSVKALNYAFVAHIKQNELKMKDMEKNMEQKTMTTTDTGVNSRLAQLEQGLRGVMSGATVSAADVNHTRLAELGKFLRTGTVEGKHIGTIDAEGGLLVSRPVSQELWHNICTFPLIANAKRIDAKGKMLRIIVDEAAVNDYAKWSKDGYDAKTDTVSPKLKAVDINTNTCCASTTVTRDFLDDMDERALQTWIQESLAISFGSRISHAILFGDEDKSLEGVFTYAAKNAEKIKTVDISDDKILEDLLKMSSIMDNKHLNQSAWYMSVEFFTKIMSTLLTQNTTQFIEMLKTTNNVNYSYTLLGKPVYIMSDMTGVNPVMLANMQHGYYLVQHENGNYKRSEAYDLDAIRYGYRMRVGGKVVDSDAFVIGHAQTDQYTGSNAAASK